MPGSIHPNPQGLATPGRTRSFQACFANLQHDQSPWASRPAHLVQGDNEHVTFEHVSQMVGELWLGYLDGASLVALGQTCQFWRNATRQAFSALMERTTFAQVVREQGGAVVGRLLHDSALFQPFWLHQTDGYGMGPLHHAARLDDGRKLDVLLHRGAPGRQLDRLGWTYQDWQVWVAICYLHRQWAHRPLAPATARVLMDVGQSRMAWAGQQAILLGHGDLLAQVMDCHRSTTEDGMCPWLNAPQSCVYHGDLRSWGMTPLQAICRFSPEPACLLPLAWARGGHLLALGHRDSRWGRQDHWLHFCNNQKASSWGQTFNLLERQYHLQGARLDRSTYLIPMLCGWGGQETLLDWLQHRPDLYLGNNHPLAYLLLYQPCVPIPLFAWLLQHSHGVERMIMGVNLLHLALLHQRHPLPIVQLLLEHGLDCLQPMCFQGYLQVCLMANAKGRIEHHRPQVRWMVPHPDPTPWQLAEQRELLQSERHELLDCLRRHGAR